MMIKQLEMLSYMFNAILAEHECTEEEAFDILLHYIAVKIGLEQQLVTPPIKAKAHKQLGELFDEDVLKENMWDYIGQFGVMVGVLSELKSKPEIEAQILGLNVKPATGAPRAILIQNAQTGRDVFGFYDVLGSNAIYCATETNLRAYRIALINMHLFNIPSHILFADHTQVDVSLGSMNWRQANIWEPVKPVKLKQA